MSHGLSDVAKSERADWNGDESEATSELSEGELVGYKPLLLQNDNFCIVSFTRVIVCLLDVNNV
jgi:hypothetical protein